MTIEMLETKNPMKRMSAAKFESQCLALIDQIAKTGKPILITKRGRPLVRIEPVQRDDEIFGYMAGKVKILGDIVGPIIPLARLEYGRVYRRSRIPKANPGSPDAQGLNAKC